MLDKPGRFAETDLRWSPFSRRVFSVFQDASPRLPSPRNNWLRRFLMAVGCIFTNINIHIEWLYNIYMYRYTNTYIDQLSILKHTTVVCIYIYIYVWISVYIYIYILVHVCILIVVIELSLLFPKVCHEKDGSSLVRSHLPRIWWTGHWQETLIFSELGTI